jgi:hypothetical protein
MRLLACWDAQWIALYSSEANGHQPGATGLRPAAICRVLTEDGDYPASTGIDHHGLIADRGILVTPMMFGRKPVELDRGREHGVAVNHDAGGGAIDG